MVTDHKSVSSQTAPSEAQRLVVFHCYASLFDATIVLLPSQLQCLHLREPEASITIPTDQSPRGLQIRTKAVWKAIETACERDDFRPQQGPLCNWCSFQQWCPPYGGNPADAPR